MRILMKRLHPPNAFIESKFGERLRPTGQNGTPQDAPFLPFERSDQKDRELLSLPKPRGFEPVRPAGRGRRRGEPVGTAVAETENFRP